MSLRTIAIGAAVVVLAVPAAAQQRGTVEFGAFGSMGAYDKTLTLDRGFGGGGHIGVYLDPRWALEFENSEMKATRTLGLAKVNVGVLTGRLVATPIHSGALSIMVGAGAGGSTETNFLHTYGVNGLVGARIALSDYAAIRADFIKHWFANYDWKGFNAVHVGLSLYRSPTRLTRNVLVAGTPIAAPECPIVPDSVSWQEMARLRAMDRDYRNLRDSLSRIPPPPPTVKEIEILETHIEFAFDKSDITDSASRILDAKVQVFRDNPNLKIFITGHTDKVGTANYNEALGERRALAAKAYIVSKGIDASRIVLDSKGETQPLVQTPVGATKVENAPNRRDMFMLIISPDAPKKP